MLTGDVLRGEISTASFIEIEDERRERVGIIHFRDVVQVITEASCDPGSSGR